MDVFVFEDDEMKPLYLYDVVYKGTKIGRIIQGLDVSGKIVFLYEDIKYDNDTKDKKEIGSDAYIFNVQMSNGKITGGATQENIEFITRPNNDTVTVDGKTYPGMKSSVLVKAQICVCCFRCCCHLDSYV